MPEETPPQDPQQDPNPQGQQDPGKKGPDPVPYDRFRAVNEENKTLKDQVAALNQKIQESEDAGKTELQKLTEKLTSLETNLESERLQNMKMRVAQTKGIPANLVDRLQGSTQEELEADAESLAAFLKPAEAPGARTPPKGGKAPVFDLANKSPEEIRKAMSEGKISFKR